MVARQEVAAPAPPPSTVAEMVAQLLEHGGLPVETKLEDGAAPILRTILHLDGSVVTYVSAASLGTPELPRALAAHVRALDESIEKLVTFARSFDGLGPVFRWVGLVAPPLVDALLEHHPVHAGVALLLSGGAVSLASLIKRAPGRRTARAVAEAVHEIRRRR